MERKTTAEASVHHSLAGGPVGREALDGLPRELAFSPPEYERRLGLVRERMDAEGMVRRLRIEGKVVADDPTRMNRELDLRVPE